MTNIKKSIIPSIHAEINALNKIKKWKNKPKKIDVFVIRFNKIGTLTESRPCYNCIKSFEKSGFDIRNVYYSNKNGEIVKESFYTMKNSEIIYITTGMRRMKNERQKTET